jgi:hypothetical protein
MVVQNYLIPYLKSQNNPREKEPSFRGDTYKYKPLEMSDADFEDTLNALNKPNMGGRRMSRRRKQRVRRSRRASSRIRRK